MVYICTDYKELENGPLIGSGQCVALVQECAGAPLTTQWRKGAAVKGNLSIQAGTAIATFVNGKYPNKSTGNHAAIFIRQDRLAIYVLDQWKGKAKLSVRPLYFKGQDKDGNYVDPSNNADAFSIIE